MFFMMTLIGVSVQIYFERPLFRVRFERYQIFTEIAEPLLA
jgi:hypothetical protein